jgi:hypothetical protein
MTNKSKYMRALNFLAIIAIISLASFSAIGQSVTPYSKYGYGLLNDNATSMQRSMGGIGYAMSGGRQINVMNPASYASIDSLTFLWDVGLSMTNLWAKEGDLKGKSFGGGLDYITMQFPIGKYLGGSFGLVPFSSVGYSFGDEVVNGSSAQVGSGGLNQLYAGLSGRIFKGFTIGANISYLFGTTINDAYAYSNTGSETLFERVMKVRDWNLNLGLQYTVNFDKKNKATIGLTYTPGKTLRGNTMGVKYEINSDIKPDTVAEMSLKGNYSLPHSFGGGISYTHDNRIMVEADFTYQNWSKAKFTPLKDFDQSTELTNRWKVALGGQYIHNPRGNYLQRINFRLGGYYNRDYILIGTNNVKEYGISLGFGLPTPSDKTMINIGFEYKHRDTYPVSLITENYFNITVGVNFNELWFWQNKIR